MGMPIKFVNHLDNKTVQERKHPGCPGNSQQSSPRPPLPSPPSAAASGRPHYSIHAPERSPKTLGEILEYQIKAADCVMLICCYSKLGRNVLLMSPAQVPAHIQADGAALLIISKVDKDHFPILPQSVGRFCSVASVCRPRDSSLKMYLQDCSSRLLWFSQQCHLVSGNPPCFQVYRHILGPERKRIVIRFFCGILVLPHTHNKVAQR